MMDSARKGESVMRKHGPAGVLAALLLVLTACSASLPVGRSGSIALVPFFHEELGIRGVVPTGCNHTQPGSVECADLISGRAQVLIVQQAAPVPLDELIEALLSELTLEQLPEPTGSYRGSAFDWDLYAMETQIKDVGPVTVRLDLALAEGDSASYFVGMATLPEDYEANTALLQTVFTHAVYSLAPME
jgi:hypothetical protein